MSPAPSVAAAIWTQAASSRNRPCACRAFGGGINPENKKRLRETNAMTDVQDTVRALDRTQVVETTNGPVQGYR
jgi:hypothetical protein